MAGKEKGTKKKLGRPKLYFKQSSFMVTKEQHDAIALVMEEDEVSYNEAVRILLSIGAEVLEAERSEVG